MTTVGIALLLLTVGLAFAQDSHYGRENQLIPTPDCLTLKARGPENRMTVVNLGVRRDWLNDIMHWQNERLIRIACDVECQFGARN